MLAPGQVGRHLSRSTARIQVEWHSRRNVRRSAAKCAIYLNWRLKSATMVKIRHGKNVTSPRSKVTVLLSKQEFRGFDSYCIQHGYKKSTLLARLVREMISKEKEMAGSRARKSSGPGRKAR